MWNNIGWRTDCKEKHTLVYIIILSTNTSKRPTKRCQTPKNQHTVSYADSVSISCCLKQKDGKSQDQISLQGISFPKKWESPTLHSRWLVKAWEMAEFIVQVYLPGLPPEHLSSVYLNTGTHRNRRFVTEWSLYIQYAFVDFNSHKTQINQLWPNGALMACLWLHNALNYHKWVN